jgi:hypothetical protein
MTAATPVKIADIINDLKTEKKVEPKLDVQVYQQATPFRFVVEAPLEIVSSRMDMVWEERARFIPPQILEKARKGFRKTTPVNDIRNRIVNLMGGEKQFYEYAFLSIIGDAFSSNEPKPPIEIFSWASVDYTKATNGSYTIMAIGYFEPEVMWTGEKPKNFKIKMKPFTDADAERKVTEYISNAAAQHKVDIIDDNLAITMGFESLAQLTGTIRKQAEDTEVRERENKVMGAIRDFLFTKVKISPIPDGWRQSKAQEAYRNTVSRFKNEAEFLKSVNMNDSSNIITYYSQEIATTLAEQLILRSLAKGKVEGNSTLMELQQYAEAVKKHILKNITFEDTTDDKIEVEAINEG